jgi:hypothetical protein
MKSIDEVSVDYNFLDKTKQSKIYGAANGAANYTYDDSDKTYFGRNGDCYVVGDDDADGECGYEVW